MDDLHFLERLPRASFAESEMALGLYRDPALVRSILAAADAPDVERVAIALGSGDEPSWLIVARDGAFVTCLGRGMSPGPWPRVSHATVLRHAERHEALRVQVAYWEACTEKGGEVRRLLKHIFDSGARFPREAVTALVPLVPAFWPELLERSRHLDHECMTIVDLASARLLKRRDRLNTRDIEQLRSVWNAEWAKGHLLVLLGACAKDILAFADRHPQLTERLPSVLWGHIRSTCRYGLQPQVMRAMWFASRFGKCLVRPLKDALAKPADYFGYGSVPAMMLMAIAIRYDKLRAEIAKALATPSRETIPDLVRQQATEFLALDADNRSAIGDETLERYADALAKRETPPIDWASATPEAIASMLDRARRAFCLTPANLWTQPETILLLMDQAEWIVRSEPEDFYFGERELLTPWKPEDTLGFFEHLDPVIAGPLPPIRAEPKPGRNEACACGSGKKYKRCCGA